MPRRTAASASPTAAPWRRRARGRRRATSCDAAPSPPSSVRQQSRWAEPSAVSAGVDGAGTSRSQASASSTAAHVVSGGGGGGGVRARGGSVGGDGGARAAELGPSTRRSTSCTQLERRDARRRGRRAVGCRRRGGERVAQRARNEPHERRGAAAQQRQRGVDVEEGRQPAGQRALAQHAGRCRAAGREAPEREQRRAEPRLERRLERALRRPPRGERRDARLELRVEASWVRHEEQRGEPAATDDDDASSSAVAAWSALPALQLANLLLCGSDSGDAAKLRHERRGGAGGGVELRRNCDEAGGRGVVRALPLALDVLVGHGRGEATTTTTTTTCTAVNAEV